MKRIFFSIVIIAFLFARPRHAYAAMAMSFSGLPSSINQDEEFTIQTSVTGASTNTIYYLRAAFYADGTTQYFGYTYNNQGIWNNSTSDYKQFYQINTGSTGTFSGPINVKVDLLNNYFKGSGEYQFKIGRYTEAGSGPTWSDSSATTIIGPTPTPTPVPPTATPTPQPTSMPEPSATSAPTVTQAPTTTPTPKPTVTPKATPTESDILGESTISPPTPAPVLESKKVESESSHPPSLLPLFLIIAGAVLIVGSGIPFAIQFIRLRFYKTHPPV